MRHFSTSTSLCPWTRYSLESLIFKWSGFYWTKHLRNLKSKNVIMRERINIFWGKGKLLFAQLEPNGFKFTLSGFNNTDIYSWRHSVSAPHGGDASKLTPYLVPFNFLGENGAGTINTDSISQNVSLKLSPLYLCTSFTMCLQMLFLNHGKCEKLWCQQIL